MKILNQTNIDELIRRSADRELIRNSMADDELDDEVDREEEGEEWNQWLESVGW
jgi:hypothetical protein